MTIRGVIFDVDGTLVLSNDAHARAWVDAFAEAAYTIPYAQVRPLIGMGGDHLIPQIVPGLSSKEGKGQRIAEANDRIFLDKYVAGLRPTPGARQLVATLAQMGVRLIVATSAKAPILRALLDVAQVADILTEATDASDVASSKPSPDVVAAALQKIGMRPGEVLMIGDTRYDVESAARSGIPLIGMRCGGSSDADLAGAIAIYDDPAHLLLLFDESPLNASDLTFRDRAALNTETQPGG